MLNPLQYSRMDEDTLFKFGKWIDYGKSHQGLRKFPLKVVVVVVVEIFIHGAVKATVTNAPQSQLNK